MATLPVVTPAVNQAVSTDNAPAVVNPLLPTIPVAVPNDTTTGQISPRL